MKVRFANRVVNVTDNELQKYLSKGYTVVEDSQPKQVVSPKTDDDIKVVKPIIQEPKQDEIKEVKKRSRRKTK